MTNLHNISFFNSLDNYNCLGDGENLFNNRRNVGCWHYQEQQKYVQFLSQNRKSLQSKQQRKQIMLFTLRNCKIFKLMADFIGSRDGIQCRSHHIKQLRTFKQIRKIIEAHRANFSTIAQHKSTQLQCAHQINEQKSEEKRELHDSPVQNGQCSEKNEMKSEGSLGWGQDNQNTYVFCQFPFYNLEQPQILLVLEPMVMSSYSMMM